MPSAWVRLTVCHTEVLGAFSCLPLKHSVGHSGLYFQGLSMHFKARRILPYGLRSRLKGAVSHLVVIEMIHYALRHTHKCLYCMKQVVANSKSCAIFSTDDFTGILGLPRSGMRSFSFNTKSIRVALVRPQVPSKSLSGRTIPGLSLVYLLFGDQVLLSQCLCALRCNFVDHLMRDRQVSTTETTFTWKANRQRR